MTPPALEAKGDGFIIRFFYSPQETGFDSLHADCMVDRLAGPMDTDPRVEYEYEFLSGEVGERRILDSAFKVRYDKPVYGYQDWRERTITIVGLGQSLCVIAHCPVPVWKKSKDARALLDGIVKSISFKPWP
jgi:hypothetical protein